MIWRDSKLISFLVVRWLMAATQLFTVQRDSTNLHEISSEDISVRKKNNHLQSGRTSSAPLKKNYNRSRLFRIPTPSGKGFPVLEKCSLIFN